MQTIPDQNLEQKKRYLKSYRRNRSCLERLEEKLAGLDARIYGLKSPMLSDMPKGGKGIDREDLINDKLELQERINRLNRKGRKLKSEILDLIDELEDVRYIEVLEEFLIDCKSFRDIAEDNCYTERHVIRLYSEAMRELLDICQYNVGK